MHFHMANLLEGDNYLQIITLRGPAVDRVLKTYGPLLTELRAFVPDLILCGGAVRDVYFGRPVKDLDFMSCDSQAPRVLAEHYNEPVTPCDTGAKDVGEYEGDGSSLIGAYENPTKSFNVLWVVGVDCHISRFPDSISQIWTDGAAVYASKPFTETAASRTVLYTNRMSDERLARIHSKYPDFSFVHHEAQGS
jgi:hypothetical protein